MPLKLPASKNQLQLSLRVGSVLKKEMDRMETSRKAQAVKTYLLLLGLALNTFHVSCTRQGLTCSETAHLFSQHFTKQEHPVDTRFDNVEAKCTDTLTEGKSATALLTVSAVIVRPGPAWRQFGGYDVIDPFGGHFVKPKSVFNLTVKAQFKLYDSGWRLESYKVESHQVSPPVG